MNNRLRTILLAITTASSIATAAPQTGNSLAPVGDYRFRVLLDGEEIGFHHTHVVGSGKSRIVTTEARFNVNLLFIDLYTYDHRATEVWQQDCLAEISSTTDDNGRSFFVEGRPARDGFMLETQDGTSTLPACIMPFAYWNPAILSQKKLLNGQNGEYVRVTVSAAGEEDLEVSGRAVPAERYAIDAAGKRLVIWYAQGSREWIALEADTRDRRKIRYERVSPLTALRENRARSGTDTSS